MRFKALNLIFTDGPNKALDGSKNIRFSKMSQLEDAGKDQIQDVQISEDRDW